MKLLLDAIHVNKTVIKLTVFMSHSKNKQLIYKFLIYLNV